VVLKILYIAGKQRTPDYLCDMVLHGLKSLHGDHVADVHRAWFMYRSDCELRSTELKQFHGKGFTLYGLLPDDAGVDRADIPAKIRNHWFDIVVYGSAHRCLDYLDMVVQYYPRERVAFIDGEDVVTICTGLTSKGYYFKREHRSLDPVVLPISFAIPAEKIREPRDCKSMDFSPLAPVGKSITHNLQFERESDYYDHYSDCYYALTWKKGGWDCLRHYEIIASGAVPFFVDFQKCPRLTMHTFPKEICLGMMQLSGVSGPLTKNASVLSGMIDQERFNDDEYMRMIQTFSIYARHTLTTEALARRVLETFQIPRPAYLHMTGAVMDGLRQLKRNGRALWGAAR